METIAAIATPSGRGGIGVIRVSGPAASAVVKQVTRVSLKPRLAQLTDFLSAEGELLDQGLAIFFQKPHSFTGEDVLELQGHGGPVVLNRILKAVLETPNVRLARPGEFSEQAFLNHKIDLAQAEAIADLIDAESTQAASCAIRSLQGEFSKTITSLVDQLIHLRKYVEASIDFPEEEIDFLADEKIGLQLNQLMDLVSEVLQKSEQGRIMREGLKVVIAGRPNAGKSSLLNALSGESRAIVTDIPGTTRDLLRETILIDGLPIHLVDTAGLRDSTDPVEQEGIRRAKEEIAQADLILLIQDDTEPSVLSTLKQECFKDVHASIPLTLILNKIDRSGRPPSIQKVGAETHLALSVKEGIGLGLLKQHLKQQAGMEASTEGIFLARLRHLNALKRAQCHLKNGAPYLKFPIQGELLAEELRLAQESLSEITGEFRPDDLLGEIFSSFCIGK